MEQNSLAAEADKSGVSVRSSLNRSKEAIGSAAAQAVDSASADLEALRRDINSLRDTVATFMSQAGNEAVKSARDVSSALAEQGATMASSAAERGKSLLGDLEDLARRNPLATLAGAVVVGMLIASWGPTRGRRH